MSDDVQQREAIRSLLAGELPTEEFPRADTPEQRNEIVHRLQTEAADLTAKLVIAGFALNPVEHGGFTQHCQSCMYFQMHRKHCELPELDVPVEPEWSCRLWRI